MSSSGPAFARLTSAQGMCKNIVEKGNLDKPLILYNRTQKRADDLSQKLGTDKTRVVSSVAEAVQSAEIIFVCVADDAADRDTIRQIVEAKASNHLIVDCSTVHPETTAELSKTVTDAGHAFVACPVFGAPAMADAGQLVCVLAGKGSDIDRVLPYCTGVMGKGTVEFKDEPPQKAPTLKLIGNTMVLQMVESLSEGHTLAEKTGLGVEYLHSWIEQMFPGPFTAYSNRLKSGDYYTRQEPLFAIDLGRKDCRHALDLAKSSGTQMRGLDVISDHLDQASQYTGPSGDMPGIYGAVRLESGLPYENQKGDEGKAKRA